MSYQGYAHGLGREVIERLEQMVIGEFKPDLTIILDISIDMGIGRASRRGGLENRYEKMGKEFHERVANGFREIAKLEPKRCVLIDANDSIENIQKKIVEVVEERLGVKMSCQ
jgi:dTMP kinase